MIFKRPRFIIVVILILGALTGFLSIGEVPPGMSHDELEYINNGYSIYKTGKDLYGDTLPLSTGGVGYVAIPAYIAGLPALLFGLKEWSVRLPAAIFGTVEILLLYLISKLLFKSEKIALSSAFILALSTWGLKISRIMLDSTTALFFFMLGIYFFLRVKKTQGIILSWAVLGLGTLSYYGSLFIFPFVVLALSVYRWDFLKRNKKKLFIGSLGVFLILGVVLGLMLFTPGETLRSSGRSGELIIFKDKNITDNVIYDRSMSISSELPNRLFINKATYLWRTFFFNYLEAFSPRMIFVAGDPNANYGLWGRGELSILDFPLFISGLFYLYKKSKKALLFTGFLILTSPITSGLTGTVYATRAFLMWPFLIIICGGGLAAFYEWTKLAGKSINWRTLVFLTFIAFYIFFFFSRIHQYFLRYPVYAKEAWFDSEKQVANYLIAHKSEKIDVYSLEGRQMFMEYFFFSELDPGIAQAALDKKNIRADIIVGNFKFVNGCFDPKKDVLKNKVIVNTHCSPMDVSLSAETIKARDGSNQVKWAIFNPEN